MKLKRNNKSMVQLKKELEYNWKRNSEGYLMELDTFLEQIKNITEDELRRDILMTMLRCDEELTKLAEKLFFEYYTRGYRDGKKNNSRVIYRNN